MNKNYLILLAFCLLMPFVVSNTISSFTLPAVVPLNQNLTFYGVYSDANGSSNILCSFYIFDLSDQNQLIMRLSDEYTSVSGAITSTPYAITEPLFRRGFDYNAVMYCNTAVVSKVFYVEQKEDYALGINPAGLSMDLAYFLNPNNSYTLIFIFCAVIIVLSLLYFVYGKFR